MMRELIIDSFAGGGGASLGIQMATGRAVDIAINHDRAAIEMHMANHPCTRHLCEDVWQVDPLEATSGRPVGLAWFSPDCKHFSKAKGGRPVSKKIRGLAWAVIRWAAKVRPRVIILENVEEFQTWGPLLPSGLPCPQRKGQTFRSWTAQLRRLGYNVQWREMRACDYGAPTTRRRLFLIARCDDQPIVWPEPTHGPGRLPYHTAAECIDWTLPCPSIFDRKRPLAENTLRRIAQGIQRYVLEDPHPFIVTCNHAGPEFRGQNLNQPFRTITAARDAHGLVAPFIARICQNGGNGQRVSSVDAPLRTIVSKNEDCLVAAHIAKHYGGVVGQSVSRPLGTVTSIDHHGLVYAFLTKYFGTNIGTTCHDPLQTITSKHRFGLVLVQVNGEPYAITDIGLRMLTPRELARAQGFPDSYILTGSKANQIARIGNSVCPAMAQVLVQANCTAEVLA